MSKTVDEFDADPFSETSSEASSKGGDPDAVGAGAQFTPSTDKEARAFWEERAMADRVRSLHELKERMGAKSPKEFDHIKKLQKAADDHWKDALSWAGELKITEGSPITGIEMGTTAAPTTIHPPPSPPDPIPRRTDYVDDASFVLALTRALKGEKDALAKQRKLVSEIEGEIISSVRALGGPAETDIEPDGASSSTWLIADGLSDATEVTVRVGIKKSYDQEALRKLYGEAEEGPEEVTEDAEGEDPVPTKKVASMREALGEPRFTPSKAKVAALSDEDKDALDEATISELAPPTVKVKTKKVSSMKAGRAKTKPSGKTP